jgi:hypothetical protein
VEILLNSFTANLDEFYRGFSALVSVRLFSSCDVCPSRISWSDAVINLVFRLNSRHRKKNAESEAEHAAQTALRFQSFHNSKQVRHPRSFRPSAHVAVTDHG